MANPRTAHQIDIPPRPSAANPKPAPVIEAVTTLGIRLVRISTTVATSTPATSTTNETLNCVGKSR